MHIHVSLCDHQDAYPPTKVINGSDMDCGIMNMHSNAYGLRFRYGACIKVLGFSLGLVFFQVTIKLECVLCLFVVTRFSFTMLNVELSTLLSVELSTSLSAESLSLGF
jgi:hypothetical protein